MVGLHLKTTIVFIPINYATRNTHWIIIKKKTKLLIPYTFNSEPSYPLSL